MRKRLLSLTGYVTLTALTAMSNGNLLKNAGFEESLDPAWQKRTPDSGERKLYRLDGCGQEGAGVVLENIKPTFTRLRQGHDQNIKIAPGSLIEFSAWTRSEMSEEGITRLQLYCMGDNDAILAQPTSKSVRGRADWRKIRMSCIVPEKTLYVLAYLQTRDGVGKAYFDNAKLVVRRPPDTPLPPPPAIALLTDLPKDHDTLRYAGVLFENLYHASLMEADSLGKAHGVLALYQNSPPPELWPAVAAFAAKGGRVFMDIRGFALCHNNKSIQVEVGKVGKAPLLERMATGLRVVGSGDATAGYEKGQIMVRANWRDGTLAVLPADFKLSPGMEVLAIAPGGEPGLVQLKIGRGLVTTCDLLSMREPYVRNIDSYYAFTPVSGALGNPVRLGKHFPKRLSYEEFVAEMRALAEKFPALKMEDEGEASGGYQLWSLNIGAPDTPLYFMYGATHGSEWEPGYGLLAFAQRVAEGRVSDAIDLSKARIKILPILNPYGYVNRRRTNANGVDLNRQGDYEWVDYKGVKGVRGKDSPEDAYGPYPISHDWKGKAPFTELEAVAYQRIIQDPKLLAVLDYHGNTSAINNKLAFLPVEGCDRNESLACEFQRITMQRLRGRHLLRQNDEDDVSEYLINRITRSNGSPMLINSVSGRYGMLVEITCGYGESYGTLLQSDVTCEICRALLLAYNPEATKGEAR